MFWGGYYKDSIKSILVGFGYSIFLGVTIKILQNLSFVEPNSMLGWERMTKNISSRTHKKQHRLSASARFLGVVLQCWVAGVLANHQLGQTWQGRIESTLTGHRLETA